MRVQVVGVRAINDNRKVQLTGERHEAAPEFALAEVAPVGRIGRVARVVEFMRLDLAHRREVLIELALVGRAKG